MLTEHFKFKVRIITCLLFYKSPNTPILLHVLKLNIKSIVFNTILFSKLNTQSFNLFHYFHIHREKSAGEVTVVLGVEGLGDFTFLNLFIRATCRGSDGVLDNLSLAMFGVPPGDL